RAHVFQENPTDRPPGPGDRITAAGMTCALGGAAFSLGIKTPRVPARTTSARFFYISRRAKRHGRAPACSPPPRGERGAQPGGPVPRAAARAIFLPQVGVTGAALLSPVRILR